MVATVVAMTVVGKGRGKGHATHTIHLKLQVFYTFHGTTKCSNDSNSLERVNTLYTLGIKNKSSHRRSAMPSML